MPRMGRDTFVRIRTPGGAGGYIMAPVLTTTQRDALTGEEGMIIFNSTTDQLEEYDGATWQAVGQIIMDTHIDDLDAHTKNIYELLRTGAYTVGRPIGGSNASQAIIADRLYAVPFLVARAVTFDRIAIEVATGQTSGKIRLGIYNDGTNLYPGTLVVDAGEVVATATAVVAATIAQSLTKGLYWLVCVANVASIAVAMNYDATDLLGLVATNFADRYSHWYVAHSYAALPDPFTAGGTIAVSWRPAIGLRPLTLD